VELDKGLTMQLSGRTVLISILAVIVLAVLWFRWGRLSGPALGEAAPLPAALVPEGQNGLSPAERERFYHLSEGGELYPLDWILALEVETTAPDGRAAVRPFLENIERYGFLSDPKSAGNPYGLPVGVSFAPSKIDGILKIGLNCTACHVGQVQYQNHAVRIDGLGNMALVNQFLQDMALETERTIANPRRLERFWERVNAVRDSRRASPPPEAGDAPGTDETTSSRIVGLFTRNRGLLESQVAALRNLSTLKQSLAISVKEGYGRLDAFGIGRDELFGAIAGNSLPADAPVSLPHIWGMQYTGWLQWGANTNSVMERNIGQALGVGALFDKSTFRSTVRLDNLHTLEGLAYKITPPQWPASFPAIDSGRAAEGRALFAQHCAPCHETYQTDGAMRNYKLFTLAEVGTDPMTALSYERSVKQADGRVRPFPYGALDLVAQIKKVAYQEAGFSSDKIAEFEQRATRKGPLWNPTFRAPLLDADKWEDTKGRKVYRAKTLVGIWATAPFLHNGSVPTIYDLLKPAAERPLTFPTGQREYDPVKLGTQTDRSKFVLPVGMEPFEFDTRLPGNWNSGHEWSFYPSLTDDMRYAIIEFLKSYSKEPY
jgi:cytochrome c peroxidase